jgi:hypothetical protein
MTTKATVSKPKVLAGFAQRGPRRRNRRPRLLKPPLSIKQILAWADAHHVRTGVWPHQRSGEVHEQPFENWNAIHYALYRGYRGLPGGSTLTDVLVKHRGIRNRGALPRLTIRRILFWTDAYHERTGRWPKARSGPVEGSGGETWKGIETALRQGIRGLRGGSSLPRLLEHHRHASNQATLPPLTAATVLKWADAHHRRTGRWPTVTSGSIQSTRDEKWSRINTALHTGCRGLPGGLSLNLLLAKYRGVPKRVRLPMLTEERILAWADTYHRRTGTWPKHLSGQVGRLPGVTWRAVDGALRRGFHSLPGGDSLHRLLVRHGRIKPHRQSGRGSGC